MIDYKLEHVISYRARLDRPQVIGPTPDGLRVFFPVAEGEVGGPAFTGTVLPGGGDWLTVRPDGIQLMDVRSTVRTHDGAMIDVSYTGVGDLGPHGYERFAAGDLPRLIPLRAAGRFRAAGAAYLWLNRLQCVFVGEADTHASEVRYDVYALQ